jgi:hypothetical protein
MVAGSHQFEKELDPNPDLKWKAGSGSTLMRTDTLDPWSALKSFGSATLAIMAVFLLAGDKAERDEFGSRNFGFGYNGSFLLAGD